MTQSSGSSECSSSQALATSSLRNPAVLLRFRRSFGLKVQHEPKDYSAVCIFILEAQARPGRAASLPS